MKSTFGSATAVLRGFAGWVSGRTSIQITDEVRPFIVSACGYQSRDEGDSVEKAGRFDASRDRWSPGINHDNFS